MEVKIEDWEVETLNQNFAPTLFGTNGIAGCNPCYCIKNNNKRFNEDF